MPRVSTQEFERVPLRAHTVLAGVPLHDVWFVDLPRWRAGVTLDDFLRTPSNCKLDSCACSKSSSLFTPSHLVWMLLGIRFFVGRFFGWDREPATPATFATRLTDTDRSRSLVTPGMRDGLFRVIYRFENEQLLELINRTVHAAALSALVETTDCLPVLFRDLCPHGKPLHVILHGTDRPSSETDHLSIALAQYPYSLESSIWRSLTRK